LPVIFTCCPRPSIVLFEETKMPCIKGMVPETLKPIQSGSFELQPSRSVPGPSSAQNE
jgi:hypothetical protein